MKTPTEVIEFIDKHAENLLIPRSGHAALMQILAAARQQVAQAATEKAIAESGVAADAGGPG